MPDYLAFEPFEENYRLLQINLAAAGASAVEAFQMALTGESGLGGMVDGGSRSQDHRLAIGVTEGSDLGKVRTCTLAEVLSMARADSVALFKCDIEGSEYDLFHQAEPELLRRVRQYAIEFHDNIRPKTLVMLQDRLRATHDLVVRPVEKGYGMLYATAKRAG